MSKILKSRREVARHFGVDVRTVDRWRARSPAMPGRNGHYEIEAIQAWREIHVETAYSVEQKAGSAEVAYGRSETRLRAENAKAEIAELKVRQMNEQFVRIDHFREWVTEFLNLQNKLLDRIPLEMFSTMPKDLRTVYRSDLAQRFGIHKNHMADFIERVDDLRSAKTF